MINNKIIIYTDGGCRGNPGIGGWGAFLKLQTKEKKIYGYEDYTTNNRMELTATIKALEYLKITHIPIDLYTDSIYVKNGITEWIENWRKKNWQTANKKPIKNIDLWQKLDALNKKYLITWYWVKGHSGSFGNDIADELANRAMDKAYK